MVKIPVEYSRTDLHVKHRNDIKMYACMYVYVCSYGCIDVRVYVLYVQMNCHMPN